MALDKVQYQKETVAESGFQRNFIKYFNDSVGNNQ